MSGMVGTDVAGGLSGGAGAVPRDGLSSRLSPRLMVAGTLGNVLEWYDFAVYGFLAGVFAKTFFPDSSPVAAMLSVFGVFAASFLMRPLGSVLFGHLGDRYGRRAALLTSAGLMSLSTVAVGLLPTYETAGALAPALLLLLRLAQGLSVGGEYMTSAIFLAENAPVRRRGAVTSLVIVGCNGGMLLGSAVGALVSGLLSTEQLFAWGWRLPFLLGVLLGGFALVLRRAVADEPPPEKTPGLPLVLAFREDWRDMLRAILMTFVVGVAFYLVFVYLVTWLQQADHFPRHVALELNTVSMAVVMLACLGFAALSDRIGRRGLVVAGFGCLALFSWPLFLLLRSGDPTLALLGQLGFAVIVSLYGGPIAVALVEMFPRHTRCTAVGLSWNVGLGIGGGAAPMVSVMLVSLTGNAMAPAFYLIVMGVVAFLAALTLRETRGRPL
ncbi:MFS transporter [Xanthobacter autotrophicus DSM 431]|uniref:MFS transporter n=1 Tax=Xanthobacter nonsaccharivorans TaxID=3119912 RepID=UPI003727F192